MTKVKYITLCIFTACIFASCIRDYVSRTNMEYKNATSHTITLNLFKNGEKVPINSLWGDKNNIIKPDSSVVSFMSGPGKDKILIPYGYSIVDSVVVLFGNKKKSVHLSKSIELKKAGYIPYENNRNFLNINSSYEKNVFHEILKNIHYKYTFTEADYKAATDCNGKCE